MKAAVGACGGFHRPLPSEAAKGGALRRPGAAIAFIIWHARRRGAFRSRQARVCSGRSSQPPRTINPTPSTIEHCIAARARIAFCAPSKLPMRMATATEMPNGKLMKVKPATESMMVWASRAV